MSSRAFITGIGVVTNNFRHGFASRRAHCAERVARALSVAMPVLAYIWRYSFEHNTKPMRFFSDFTARERRQTWWRL